MEFLEAAAFLLEILAGIADVVGAVVDVGAWIRSRPNREERRTARRAGEPLPPRNVWTWLVVILTPVVAVLTAYLIWRWRPR